MTKYYLFICLIIVILTQKLLPVVLTRKDRLSTRGLENQRISFLLLEYSRNCSYTTSEFSFTLDYCKQYPIGSTLTLIGRQDPQSDKRFFAPKRLTVHDVRQNAFSKSSVNGWLALCVQWSNVLKRLLLQEVSRVLPEPHLGLVTGMVFGGTQQLSTTLEKNLRVAGMTHVVSASGYNLSVVVGLGMFFLKKLPRVLQALGGLLLVFSYTMMANAVPPILRGAVMISLNLIGSKVFFRKYHPTYSLFLSTACLLWWQPWFARSLSFWLSVGATAGIVLILPLLERSQGWFSRLATGDVVRSPANISPPILVATITATPTTSAISSAISSLIHHSLAEVRLSFVSTVAAQAFTMPLIALTFGEVSWLSFITNPLLLWLTPLITLSGLLFMVVGAVVSIVPSMHQVFVALAQPVIWLPAELFLESVGVFGTFSWGVVKVV